jgi:hypothetical protein
MAFRVNDKMCRTCIFGNKSPINAERFAELRESWTSENRAQQCHHSSMKDGDTGCRGHYEAGKRGEIHHPVTTFARHFEIPLERAYSMFESMGLIEFEAVDDAYLEPINLLNSDSDSIGVESASDE